MDVKIQVNQKERDKMEEKALVFCDVEFRIYPSLAEMVGHRCKAIFTECDWRGSQIPEKLILKGACGALRPARLTFILGPSGAGKSTLLQILTGRKRGKGVSGYLPSVGRGAVLVTQQVNLLPALTARETLSFAAGLKLPCASVEYRRAVVERVVRQLGIESVMAVSTAKMSGGERKRLSVACELLTDPPVLLLDEPTSGLDSVSSVSVIQALCAVASSGRTVACVLHQPSSRLYSMSDDLILLSEGRTLYAGPREAATGVLQRAGFECPSFYNPADFLLEVAAGEHSGDLNVLEREANAYAKNPPITTQYEQLNENGKDQNTMANGCNDYQKNGVPADEKTCPLIEQPRTHCNIRKYAACGNRQVKALLWRCGVSGLRDVHLTQLRLGAHVLVALLLGALYAGSGSDAARYMTNVSCIFFFLLFLFFSNAMPTIHTFPSEAEVVIQEHLNYWYCIPAYWLSKILADIPGQLICATVFTIPAWYLTGQLNEYWRVFYMWLVCLLLTTLAQTMGLAIGAACDVKASLFIVPASNIPMLMFSGYFIPYDQMPNYLQPLAWLSYFRYALDAALQSIYGFNREKLPCSVAYCHDRYPGSFLKRMSLPNDYWGSLSGLVVWIVVLQALLLVILLLRVRYT